MLPDNFLNTNEISCIKPTQMKKSRCSYPLQPFNGNGVSTHRFIAKLEHKPIFVAFADLLNEEK